VFCQFRTTRTLGIPPPPPPPPPYFYIRYRNVLNRPRSN